MKTLFRGFTQPPAEDGVVAPVAWYDRPGPERSRERRSLSPKDREKVDQWLQNGFLIIPGAVPTERIDKVLTEIDRLWSGVDPRVHIEHYTIDQVLVDPIQPEWRPQPHKLLDAHAMSGPIQEALTSPELMKWLRILVGEQVLAFQSLAFERGTEQGIHRDTSFVGLDPARRMVACWMALEDIEEGTGGLEYFVGSHRSNDYIFPNGDFFMIPDSKLPSDYTDHWYKEAERMGLTRSQFTPRKGDVLLWHSGLAHGGSKVTQHGSSRKSLVTHYCPLGARPYYARDDAWGPWSKIDEHLWVASTWRSDAMGPPNRVAPH